MPKAPSNNTFQITLKIPDEWVAMADELARAMSRPGIPTTRTDVFRAALLQGLATLQDKHLPK